VPFATNALIVLAAGSGGSSGKSGGLGPLIPFLLIAVVGYLLLVRPARARQRRALENRRAIEPGLEVTTTAGLIATVVAVDDDTVTLEVAPGVHSRYVKAAIGRVNTPPEPEPETYEADTGETDSSGDTPAGTGA
jgi:preprotein translocase subunit YajC